MMEIGFKEVKGASSKCFQVRNASAAFKNNVMTVDHGVTYEFRDAYYPVCYKAGCSKDSNMQWTVTMQIGNKSYTCYESRQEIIIHHALDKTYEVTLICPLRMDVFCGDPQKGVKIEVEPEDDDEDILITILKFVGLTGLLIMGVIVYCVVKNKPK
jgi:hypothetical protein